MLEGRQRKRLVRLARTIPIEDIRRFVCLYDDDTCCYFVLRTHEMELLRSWQFARGRWEIYELLMEDEVFYAAIIEHVKSQGLVFESEQSALAHARISIFPKFETLTDL